MNENGLQNRHSLASESAAFAAVLPGGAPQPPATADSATLATPTPLPRRQPGGGSPKTRTTMLAGRGGVVSLWSCGLGLAIIFCLAKTQVLAFPLDDAPVDKSAERSKRSVSGHDLDEMALDWFLKRTDEQKENLFEAKTRVSRAVGDQIMAELEAQWIDEQLGTSGSQPSSARSRRFAVGSRGGEDEERAKSRRSFADQRLADFLVRQRLRQSKGGGGNRDAVFDLNRLGRA